MRMPHKHNDKLQTLSGALQVIKTREEEAKKLRISVEIEIAQLIEGPETGSKTVTLESGRKITVKRGINYTTDVEGLSGIMIGNCLPPLQSKTIVVLDIEGYEWYRVNDPVAFATISEFVETKPKKIAVTIKETPC